MVCCLLTLSNGEMVPSCIIGVVLESLLQVDLLVTTDDAVLETVSKASSAQVNSKLPQKKSK